jgi:hypothetical protein
MDLTQKIDVVKNMGVEEFKYKYLMPQKPVIIKGLTENKIAGDKWSINYFKESMGDFIIDLYDNKNEKTATSAYTTPDLKMKLADYLTIIEKDEHTDLRVFLFNLFKFYPTLRKEFPCPEIFKGVLDNIGHMFFGGKDTTVRIHYDIDMSNVLLTQFVGKKRIVLISPEYNELLYCLPFNTYSLVNIDNPDYEKYPALKYIKGYEYILEPGDSVFMPSGYWHYMTYLEGSFSVSYRKIAPAVKQIMRGVVNLAIYMPFDKQMNRIFSNNKWLRMKEQMAEKRATKAIKNHIKHTQYGRVINMDSDYKYLVKEN